MFLHGNRLSTGVVILRFLSKKRESHCIQNYEDQNK